MNRWLLAFGSLTAIVVGIGVALAVAGVFDGDGASSDKTQGDGDENADTAALCVEGADDCNDLIDDAAGGDGAAGTCLEGEPECNDTPDVSQVCAEDAADCDDAIDELAADDPSRPFDFATDCDYDVCESRAIPNSRADLESRLGPDAGEIVFEDIEYQEWPDACLGLAGPGDICAQVITFGWVIVFQVDGQSYEYHTDLTGNNVRLAE